MIIRMAREDDLADLLGLAGQEATAWPSGVRVDATLLRAAVAHRHPWETALVAVSGQRLVGGLLFGPVPPTYRVHWLAVEPAGSREVGQALVNAATRRFVQRPGVIEAVASTADGKADPAAAAFYERMGFQPAVPVAVPAAEPAHERPAVYRLPVG